MTPTPGLAQASSDAANGLGRNRLDRYRCSKFAG